jgi:nitroimidazol reductase NimA-like FMN-containing flavoprotein (pyridoxamine 5'-phosphate oxidase superfamily)
VCIEVSRLDGVTGDWVSVVVTGTASEVIDEKAKAETTSLLFRKYGEILGSPLSHGPGMRPLPGLPHVIEVSIEEMTGMSSGRGFSVRTKPGRL